jgi:O-acetyl-ADP-ribose deacetylase (regulator of RNase III)
LASCYRRAVEVADELGAKSMAFPAISTGIFGFPKELAAEIAVSTLRELDTKLDRVILVAFDPQTMSIYKRLITAPSVDDMNAQPPVPRVSLQ